MIPLSLLDIAAYRAQHAVGSVVLAQVTWLIEGSPDIGRIRALADRLAASSQLGRVVLPARVLGGRDHWGPLASVPEVVVEPGPVDRSAVLDWVDARGRVPVLPSSSPWHLAVRPFTDGGHAVTLVVSHALTDGVGLINALTSAGRRAPSLYAGRGPGLLTGVREALTGLPAGIRAAIAAARATGSGDGGPAPRMTSRPRPHTLVALVDSSAWHAAAAALGGSSNALFVSVAAQVAAAIGRVTADGTAIVGIPVNDRTEGDDVSANALTTVQLDLPADQIRDVAFIRAEIKRVLVARSGQDAAFVAMLPIVPYLPASVLRPVAQAALGAGDPVTTASHVGVLPRALVTAPGPASAVFLNLGMQHPDALEVPERLNALAAETPDGTVAVHLGSASDRIADAAGWRAAARAALLALGIEAREIL
ncbi:hypothetical protein F4553_000697 [Allocatelliglobosispora scoriae]|uniref:Diacylglycerol O-acyltransferase n=1 Tax=Allocatelliglobosispora scoriae TaxID=643052 RepID=A0A841BJ12_9ACTN|nr:hypothetical protein [Allocatelliglobosispora scoriae]MBB5867318.1 hypothetical protein [Allocatelliglobosispora scoriae]